MTDELVDLIADLKENEVLETVNHRLESGGDPILILDAARAGLEIVGWRFAAQEYFIPDLVYSGEILKQVVERVVPRLKQAHEVKRIGKIVFGTVAGDIHDIGKDIVAFMLDINGFEVHDLGIDVPAQSFVDKIRETGAGIVGLSGFLTLAFDSMKETIQAIEAAGLRKQVRIMIGGGQVDEQIREYTAADAFGKDALEAVTIARGWTEGGSGG